MKKIIPWCIALLLPAAGLACAADLLVTVNNVQPGAGTVKAAIYQSAAHFLSKPLQQATVPANGSTVQLHLDKLPAGQYAVAVFQDVNANGKLDSNFFKIPSEPTGSSNDARSMMGPPSYEKARFLLPEAGTTIAIKLGN